jgi:hypothetical protein
MCQWVASEIGMTQDIEERCQVVEKFIRIASHCRTRYRNFSTLVQIVLALQSSHIAGLKKTWARVSSHDVKTFKELSALVSPLRNWSRLRHEMERAGDDISSSSVGCIPFIGQYLPFRPF